ncbi:MAG: hypothetical protein KF812_08875 [Fimbriimonadaceae bacterium]|nr:hypothetical protein [Fimbriimonadaceae bacterium]
MQHRPVITFRPGPLIGFGFVVIASVMLWVGCQPTNAASTNGGSSNQPVPAVTISQPSEVFPDPPEDSPVHLIVAGYEVKDVAMKVEREGGQVRLKLTAHNETLQEEHYLLDASGLYVNRMVGETFDPPLPLVKFPVDGNQSHDYSGTVTVGQSKRDAKATVTTVSDVLNSIGGQFDCVKVTVALSLRQGSAPTQERQLVFWVSPGHGIVKREYGSEATREPAAKS